MKAAEVRSEVSPELAERLYLSMYRIRRVEEEIARVYPSDRVKSPVHLSIGQEAVATGVCEALAPGDIVFGSYRGHAMFLAKGGDLRGMIAELYGKLGGTARGKGGSMHLVDVAHGVMGTSAVVGTSIPNAVGYAYALHLRQQSDIVVSFFGDGATEEGVFSESLNFAALKRLPILFVCENNGYAIHTPQVRRQSNPRICDKVTPFGIPAVRIENNDVVSIHGQARKFVDALRSGESGPFFMECMTYRLMEHVGPLEDFGLGYRDQSEAAPWRAGDPVKSLAKAIPSAKRAALEEAVEQEIREAFAYAEASPFPGPEELARHVYKDG